MSNLCDNIFYAYTEDSKNIEAIKNFFKDWDGVADYIDTSSDSVDVKFDSRWCFPEDTMNELYKLIPNKEDIYMRCLSVEYGCDYVAYHKCDKNGWYSVI